MDDTGIKREPVIRISSDRMEAFIMLPTVEEEYHYTVDEVLEAVNRNGVIYGINCEIISDMIEKRLMGREVLFAKGKPAVDGADGYFDFYFNSDLNHRPTVKSDGSVDYWSVHSVEVVKKARRLQTIVSLLQARMALMCLAGELPQRKARDCHRLWGAALTNLSMDLHIQLLSMAKLKGTRTESLFFLFLK